MVPLTPGSIGSHDVPVFDISCIICFQEKYKNLEATLKAQTEDKSQEEKTKLPETPKNPQEIWQQSVIGDYLAKFKVLLQSNFFFSLQRYG